MTSPCELYRFRISSKISGIKISNLGFERYCLDTNDLYHVLFTLRDNLQKRLKTSLFALNEFIKEQKKCNLSIFDGSTVEETCNYFEKVTGSPIMDDNSLRSFAIYRENPFGKVNICKDRIESRGPSYYIAAHPEISDPNIILNQIIRDLNNCIEEIGNCSRKHISKKTLMGYIGIIDLLKHQSLCLYHALTFPERSKKPDSAEYETVKNQLFCHLVKPTVRMFYQSLLGLEFDEAPDQDWIQKKKNIVSTVSQYLTRSELKKNHFKLEDIDHPIKILLHSFSVVTKYPNIDTIVFLPSGGTQIACITQLMYELIQNTKPSMVPSFLSTHDVKQSYDTESLTPILSIPAVIGKKVLVTEDNSQTGNTAHIISKSLLQAGARCVYVTLAEVDPIRVVSRSARGEVSIVNPLHTDFDTAIGYVPATRGKKLSIKAPNGARVNKNIPLRVYYAQRIASKVSYS